MAVIGPQDAVSPLADLVRRFMEENPTATREEATAAAQTYLDSQATPAASSSSTPPATAATRDLTQFDSSKVNAKLLKRFQDTSNKFRDNYKDASFIKGAQTPAERKAYAIKLANTTTTGKSAADVAAIEKARQWYTGQKKGGKKAGYTDASLKSIRRGKDNKGKAGTTNKKEEPVVLTAAQKKAKAARVAAAKLAATQADIRQRREAGGRVGGGGTTRNPRVANPTPTPEKPREKTKLGVGAKAGTGAKAGVFTPGQTSGIPSKVKPKPAKMKKTGDSWKQQREPKRIASLERATAIHGAKHDAATSKTAKKIRKNLNDSSSQRTNSGTGPSPAGSREGRYGGAVGQTKEPPTLDVLTREVANWLASPGSQIAPTARMGSTNTSQGPTLRRQKQDPIDTWAELAAGGYVEKPKKSPKLKDRNKNKNVGGGR